MANSLCAALLLIRFGNALQLYECEQLVQQVITMCITISMCTWPSVVPLISIDMLQQQHSYHINMVSAQANMRTTAWQGRHTAYTVYNICSHSYNGKRAECFNDGILYFATIRDAVIKKNKSK
jgi:hypothetical protein